MARLIYEGFGQPSCCSQQYLGFCAQIKHDILIFWAVLITDPCIFLIFFVIIIPVIHNSKVTYSLHALFSKTKQILQFHINDVLNTDV